MRLTDYYAGCTVCRPSRLVLWTGRHTGHTPINSNARYVFKPQDVTVAELLRQAGYATGGVGKWAMGGPGSGGEPNRHGLDFWFGYLDQSEAHNYYPTHLFRCAGDEVERVPLKGNVLMGDTGAQRRVAKLEHRVTYSHDVMTEEALGFIRRNKAGPFLLHVHWTIPHANNEGGRVTGDGMEVPDYGIYKDRPWPTTEKGQAAMITRMDADVGRIVALLRELGVDRKTLILFTSDNGPHNEGGHKHEYFDSNGPLRGLKRDLYEGGIRVPTIAWWPGVVPAGSASSEPLAFYDFLPTACELAGVKAPGDTDGSSFLPTLLGKPDQQSHHDYLYWKFGKKEAVRIGRWKAVRLAPDRPVELY
ncbi:MAG: arylsulfatase, partial [Planctomycetota bacterium]